MGFYNLTKEQRARKVKKIEDAITLDIESELRFNIMKFFCDEDTYIRKAAYLSIGKIYLSNEELQQKIIELLFSLLQDGDFKVRQTAINAAGEIGKKNFEIVEQIFDKGLFDKHHSPRNAVIGSVKKMGNVNPVPVLTWAQKYLHHPDKEIRREICHGIELRGRTFPAEILPLLKQLQFDTTARVRSTLIHVIGQIAYKKDCIEIVVKELNEWENKMLVKEALMEIIDVHHRYRSFAVLTQQEAQEYINIHSTTK